MELRNPWGCKEWTGDYSKDSGLWTPELKKVFHEDQKDGRFWIAEKDFYTHFTESDIAKPVDPHWTMRFFSFKLHPFKDSRYKKLNQHRNFAFKLKKDVPDGKKARVRIVIEKRNTDYSKLHLEGSYLYAYLGRNGGKKLTSYDIYDCGRSNVTLSTKVSSKNDIISFVFVHKTPEEIESDCYVNVFCEIDFDLYDIDHPDNLFPKEETQDPVLDNFSITAPNAALVLVRTVINGKERICLKSSTATNFKDTNIDPRYDIIIKNLINESKSSPYKFSGTQINQRKYIFNNDYISYGHTSDAYEITERETGNELATIISIEPIERVFDNFTKKVSIMMQLKYPSIVNFIGFSENDFKEKQNPMIITDLYRSGTLEEHLKDLTNTKKMINLIGIAFGMNYIHKHNIIHRDLRCSKILLDQNMHPKIGHFNTARINTVNNEQYGRSLPYYFMAPEIVHGTKEYSFPVDVFAYGMLFYHVISNKEPTLSHKTKTDFFFKILDFNDEDKRSILDDASIEQRFRPFICSMWKEDPSERPTFEQIINQLLYSRDETWLENVDIEEVEEYIHQFGATLKKKNQSEYIEIINGIKSELPSGISKSFNHLNPSDLTLNQNSIIELAKTLHKNNASLQISIDLANIAADLNSTEAFVFLGKTYKDGRGVKLNQAMAAVNFKIAADRGDENSMFEYAMILMKFFNKTKGFENRTNILNEAKQIIKKLDGKNDYFYVEARHCFDTIENQEVSLYASKKYFEKASKKGHQKSTTELKNINRNHPDASFIPPYFEEFCQDLTDEMINNSCLI